MQYYLIDQMGIGATILMIIFFPLNSFLLLQESITGGKQVQADVSANEESIQKLVKGASVQKKQEPPKPKAQAVDDPRYQPIRKDGVRDLVVPNAHASVIIDADTGTILHYNEGRTKRQIASLTKVMTAVLAVEKIQNLNEEVYIDDEIVNTEITRIGCPRSGVCTSQRLKVGEKISARSLLRAALLNSANDAASALGKHIAGSQSLFVAMMNKKAQELGLTDTNFCTPSGLERDGYEKECYSSAYDIARIAAYSLRYDEIWNIYKTVSLEDDMKIKSTDGKIEHTLINTVSNLSQIPNSIGGKTGYTSFAGYSLLTIVSDSSGKHRVVIVVLDDNKRWQDVRLMADWTFSSYDWK